MAEFELVKHTVPNVVTVICKNNVTFATSLHIEGVIGLTVDGSKMCVIHIDETVPAVAERVPAASWPQGSISTVGCNEEASLAAQNVEYAQFLNAYEMLNQAENDLASSNQMFPASACGPVMPSAGEFADGELPQRTGSTDMMTNVPLNSTPFVLCKRLEMNVPKVHDCQSGNVDYGQGVGNKEPGAARTKKSGARPKGTDQGYGRKSANQSDYKKDVKIAKKEASTAIERGADKVMQPAVAQFQALQQPTEVNTPSKKKSPTSPVVMAHVSGGGFYAGKATIVGGMKFDHEMIKAETEMKEPWGVYNQSPGSGRGKCGSTRSPKKRSNKTSAKSSSAAISSDCNTLQTVGDQTDMYVTKVTSYVCGYMDCGVTCTEKHNLLAHQTAKHGRQPKIRGRSRIDSQPEAQPSNAPDDN